MVVGTLSSGPSPSFLPPVILKLLVTIFFAQCWFSVPWEAHEAFWALVPTVSPHSPGSHHAGLFTLLQMHQAQSYLRAFALAVLSACIPLHAGSLTSSRPLLKGHLLGIHLILNCTPRISQPSPNRKAGEIWSRKGVSQVQCHLHESRTLSFLSSVISPALRMPPGM